MRGFYQLAPIKPRRPKIRPSTCQKGVEYWRGLRHTHTTFPSPPHTTGRLGSASDPKGKFLECFTPNGLGPIFSPQRVGHFFALFFNRLEGNMEDYGIYSGFDYIFDWLRIFYTGSSLFTSGRASSLSTSSSSVSTVACSGIFLTATRNSSI